MLSVNSKEVALDELWDENHEWFEKALPKDRLILQKRVAEYEFLANGKLA